MNEYWYQNGLFIVEDDLFYENNKRIGYYQDEKIEEVKINNYKKTVDRLSELKELNIELKRRNKKLHQENKELKKQLGVI